MRRRTWTGWALRLAGLVWILGWSGALYVVATPWRELGGLISERVRWCGWFVLYAGVVLGFALGDYVREARPPTRPRAYPHLLWRMLCLPALTTAAWLVVLQSLGQRDVAGVVFTAFLSYWAGVDVALGAMPSMEGTPVSRFERGAEAAGLVAPVPPWDS